MSLSRLYSLSGLMLRKSNANYVRQIYTSTTVMAALQKPNWSNALSEAEKIVDYPTSSLGLRWLLSDDIANVGQHLHKIKDNHPYLKTAKDLIFNGKSNIQAWGLIVLLVSKAALQEPFFPKNDNVDLLQSQQVLAEAIEKIHCWRLMHQGMFNLQVQSKTTNDLINDEENKFGNVIAVLSGDYLISNASLQVAKLRNQELVELISSVARDLVESNFIGERDEQNNALPSDPRKAPEITMEEYNPKDMQNEKDVPNAKPSSLENFIGDPEKEWSYHHVMSAGTLLGKGCQGAMMLAGQPRSMQQQGYLFGKHLALAWQAYIDMEPYKEETLPAGSHFSLISAPLLYHLAHDPKSYELISKGCMSVEKIDYAEVHRQVRKGPGLEKTKNLQRKHSLAAMAIINKLPPSNAQEALQNIILAMQDL